ncbi:PTS sugar transporter subunit IIA [Shinella sp.]|uniref:PTS sugar transporter subunit IIA n=1 Tax=Shinella sp. TaxID=1870904 RepID=UPI0025880444|nr:PTS sugar transporter subunit IIA [Shinella sp.]MCW5711531.1 PTS sugar transporter subunit IIA [Shinella sp.]
MSEEEGDGSGNKNDRGRRPSFAHDHRIRVDLNSKPNFVILNASADPDIVYGEPTESALDNHELFLAMDISLGAIVPNKEAAIALAADRLADGAGMAYGDVKAALTGREALGSTALGKGIAMPHAIAPACLRPAVSLIELATSVDFDAPDHRDVDVVLALIWPHHRAGDFVRFSVLTSRVLSDPTLAEVVRQSDDHGRIRRLLHARSRALRSLTPLRVRTAGCATF